MSVEAGLAELAEATAWQRANGNTDRPCIECRACAMWMWTQTVTILRVTKTWTFCNRCHLRRLVEG